VFWSIGQHEQKKDALRKKHMNYDGTAHVIKTEGTTYERAHIAKLLEVCSQYEGLDFPFPVEEMQSQPGDRPGLLLYYQDETLLGFAYLQYGSELEVYGMVHPDYRRKGIGMALFQAAQVISRQIGAKRLLLVCDSASTAGRAFAEAVGGTYHFSEHQMKLDTNNIKRPPVWHPYLQFRRAESAEAPIIAHLIARSFGDPEEEVADWVAADILKANQRFFLASLQAQPIGTLRTVSSGQQVDIAAFGVLPDYRGQGYGRQMLLSIVDLLLQEDWQRIGLDVETENDNALGLYQACGFYVTRTYDYYQIMER